MPSLEHPQPELAPPDAPACSRAGPRTIVVGDVHGCARELEALLARLSPAAGDRVLFVGDLVDRGPDTPRAFDLLRSVRGELVLGNHEDKLLRWREEREHGDGQRIQLAPHHRETLAQLRPEDWDTMRAARRYVELPGHGAVVVHAGIRPGLPLAAQDPDDLCRLQSIGRTGRRRRWGAEGSVFWASVCDFPGWVLYGHTHFRSPLRYERTLGLDTGCCFGGALTALELPAWRLYQVRAQRNYMREMMERVYPVWGSRPTAATTSRRSPP